MERLRVELPERGRRAAELVRRLQRLSDGPWTRKKVVLYVLFAVFLLLYLGPTIFGWIFGDGSPALGKRDVCQKKFLAPFAEAFRSYDAYLRPGNAASLSALTPNFLPYIGNGLFGLSLEHSAHINIKYGRTISVPLFFHPLYVIDGYDEFTVVDYKKGIVSRYQCGDDEMQVSYQYYAHRTVPSLLVQEIWVSNPSSSEKKLKLSSPGVSDWPTAVTQTVQLHQSTDTKAYEVITGMVTIPDSDKVIAATVVSRKQSNTISVKARDGIDLVLLTSIQYSKPISKDEYATQKDIVEKKAINEIEKAIALTNDRQSLRQLRDNHIRVWNQLWYTGFYISDSKAHGVLNGDRINATMYAVLSNVRSYEHEDRIKASVKTEILRTLTYSEGCYEGHSTLDAENLWKPIDTLQQLNTVVSSWLLTMEKQGCHNLLRAGASGVNQAMVLSFGSLRFSNQHLEFNNHPSNLHRDFLFRRVNYGNMTHVNISVILQEDNKAAIFVALDRSDKTYYACDAGCLDSPVPLGSYRKYFPVKQTDPLTAILYITSDKQHMEELRHTIHVKEVLEAPAHEHHVIALHKHGHSMGGLHPLFWVSVCVLIVLFHLFLCRLIMSECSASNSSLRRLHNKP